MVGMPNVLKTVASKCKKFVFPVHSYELSRVIPLFFLFFLISFIYNLLRPLKISLVITASGSGASIIPFLKAWAILPGAFFFAYLYTTLSRYLTREKVFFILLSIFLISFCLFFVAYPYREQLELVFIANKLASVLPQGFYGLTAIIRHWDLSIFYVMSELWGNIMLTILAWGFANEIINVKEAKRFYALFACGADSAGIFSGQYAKLINIESLIAWLPFGTTAWEQTLSLTLITVLFIGITIACLYKYINRHKDIVSCNRNTSVPLAHANTTKGADTNKKELSIIKSMHLLLRSKYLIYLGLIVLCYNVTFNLFDVMWVDQLKKHYSTKSELNAYMNHLTFLTGILSSTFALLISGNCIRKIGWKKTAFITPIVFMLTGIGFFCCIFLQQVDILYGILAAINLPLHNAVIIFGTMQYCLTRACKYTVFDNTKEMAFIPLPKHEKRQGKTIIDTLVSRTSKAGSSFIYQGLFLFCSQLILTTPYVTTIIVILLIIWFFAIYSLDKIFSKEVLKQEYNTNIELDKPEAAYP